MKKLLLVVLIGLGAFFYVYRVDLVRSVQRLDTTTPQTLQSSFEEISAGLSEEEKVIFAKGILRMSAEGTDLQTLMSMSGEDEVEWKVVSKKLNGKSVRQILAKGQD